MNQDSSSEGTSRIYNLISVVMLLLTGMVLLGVIGFAVSGAKIGSGGPNSAEPTLFVLGTETPTLSFPTPQASLTPSASPTVTVTPTASRTPIPSETGTPTDTPTATNTLTPTATPTATNTALPTLTPTRTAFDFVLRDGLVVYGKYTTLVKGKKTVDPNDCGARLAGAVFGTNGNYLGGNIVHVTGSGADARIATGSNPEYGASGWEYYIFNTPVARTYNVQLEYTDGGRASDVYTVTTKADCNQGVALVNFQQVQGRQP